MVDRSARPALKERRLLEQEHAQSLKREWDGLPGTHLEWHPMESRSWRLVSPEHSVWASVRIRRGGLRGALFEVEVGGQSYEMRLLKRERQMIEIVSGREVLRSTGRHYNQRANTRVDLFDRGTLHFPVRQRGALYAVMSALDDTGRSLVEYRIQSTFTGVVRRMQLDQVDFVVNSSDLSRSQSALLVVFTSRLLPSYFDRPGGGT